MVGNEGQRYVNYSKDGGRNSQYNYYSFQPAILPRRLASLWP